MSNIITGIQPENVGEVWPVVEGWITQAIKQDMFLEDYDIYDNLLNRRMQLWIVLQLPSFDPVACYVTEINRVRDMQVLNTVALGGDGVDEWLPLVEKTICDFAISTGCSYVSLNGRRGWVRQLKSYGWDEVITQMIKKTGGDNG